MNYLQLENLKYSFEELEILKILASYPADGQRALDLLESGVNEYYIPRIEKILRKLYADGIWDFEEDDKGKFHSTFNLDLKETIINHPNPIPENYKKNIDAFAILEKLPNSNLDSSEINYLSILLKKDVINQTQKS